MTKSKTAAIIMDGNRRWAKSNNLPISHGHRKGIETLIDIVKEFGGVISNRKKPDGTETVYELNIALLDAMKGTFKGIDHMQIERFIACHAIMLSLEGIPAFYIHSVQKGSDADIYKERKMLGSLLTSQIEKSIKKDYSNTVFSFIPNTAETSFYGLIVNLIALL